jgi:TetR/AcrR family transcriptional repressor of nem operon
MKRGPTPKKQETHDRIVRTAAGHIRERGYDNVSVADLMEAAGLTHGGFYAHFESRDAMLAEALDAAAADSLGRLGKASDDAAPEKALLALLDFYLSDRHVAHPELGCTLAALGSETPRQTPEVRRVMTRRIKEMVDLVERQLPGWGKEGRHEEALGVLSTMLGALILSRAVEEPALGKEIRTAAKQLVARGVSARPAAKRH